MQASHADASPRLSLRASLVVFLTLAGAACGMTLLFLGMRAVMAVGGACADGNPPYVIATPCPRGVPLAVFGGVFGGLACLGAYGMVTAARQIPNLIAFAWPALFLSLGWNFVEFGVRPVGGGGLVWAWLLCGVLFAAMGAVPLLIAAPAAVRRFSEPAPSAPRRSRSLAERMRAPGALRLSDADSTSVPSAERVPGAELVAALERLATLHRAGALDEAEYRAAKDLLIGQGGGS
jgi:hypothetical protein